MTSKLNKAWSTQQDTNSDLLVNANYLGETIQVEVLAHHINLAETSTLTQEHVLIHQALEIEAAKIAIGTLASLAEISELDHLGGGLDLISALMLTLAVTDYRKINYTIEHAHTSIGYYASLAALGFFRPEHVINGFRRGLDFPGHVSWIPGGTQLNGGRLGVMVPVAVGQALGTRCLVGNDAWVITHCGDAGWISGQALNGFNGAALHSAPVTFIMHRNGIQLSGSTRSIMDKDPRRIIESMGIEIIETPTLHDVQSLYGVYREAYDLARTGKPNLIYPVGSRSSGKTVCDLNEFGKTYGILDETAAFAGKQNISMDTEIWIPGSLMSYRDVEPMLECLFLVNDLPGGAGHHDGHMKGRKASEVLANPMLQPTGDQIKVLEKLNGKQKKMLVTKARPNPGTPNLLLPDDVISSIELPLPGCSASARAGTEAAYAAIAQTHPDKMFVVSCDLDASTKLKKARQFLKSDHQFEMSIEEQAAALMANGLALSGATRQLNVFSTFAAFFEGIAREGFDMWRYQRNLNGVNEGLNVTFHLSHVGACTGRDHFSGWGLDWITLGLGYLPYIHRFYAPADARSAFIAVRDLAAHYGGHIIGVPRDNLPILEKQNSNEPLWDLNSELETITSFRRTPGARKAILAFGAPAFLASQSASELARSGVSTDVFIVNALPLSEGELPRLIGKYGDGIVTIEDGLIGNATTGLRGFASLVATTASDFRIPLAHLGIIDPRIAPSEGHMETWTHFGITADALVSAVREL